MRQLVFVVTAGFAGVTGLATVVPGLATTAPALGAVPEAATGAVPLGAMVVVLVTAGVRTTESVELAATGRTALCRLTTWLLVTGATVVAPGATPP